MQDQIISFETAKLAKEKGFNEQTWEKYQECNQVLSPSYLLSIEFEEFIKAPTQSLLKKWLREKYNIYIQINVACDTFNRKYKGYFYEIVKDFCLKSTSQIKENYEIILEEALQIGLKMIKND